jgi:hypothetical protein
MPNHVTTIVQAAPKVLQRILSVEDGEQAVNFKTIIPMPDTVFQGELSSEDEQKYPGDLNWYDWSINHWGTKWNAYETVIIDDDKLSFQTAWSAPWPIFEEWSRQCPEEVMTIAFADEDLGSNLGMFQMKDGVIVKDSGIQNQDDAVRREFASYLIFGSSYEDVCSDYDADDSIGLDGLKALPDCNPQRIIDLRGSSITD